MILLIDADIPCYSAASSAEQEFEWEQDVWSVYSDLKRAKEHFDHFIQTFQKETGVYKYKLCFSDTANFRKTLNPSYKSNRKGKKPIGYTALKEWAMDNYESISKPNLEADDVLGILATKYPGKTIIVSQDKDLLSIPGRMYRTKQGGGGEMIDTDQTTADYRFLLQALTGDSTDGYGGCPGIGNKKAEDLFKKHGAVWKTVEDAYIKAGLTTEDAVMNARMARILRIEDYDFDTDEVRLWNPSIQ